MINIKQIIQAIKEDLMPSYQKPSLLAYNIDWFTNCSWIAQMTAFKQISRYF